MRGANGDEELEQRRLDAALRLHGAVDAGANSLPDARHAREVGRIGVDQIRQHYLANGLREGDPGAGEQRRILADALVGVPHRQHRKQQVAGAERHRLRDRVDLEDEVGMGEHDALRFAGRAGGVDDGGQVVGLALGQLRAQQGFRLAVLVAGADQVVQGNHFEAAASGLGPRRAVEVGLIEHDGACQFRQPVLDAAQLRQLCGIFDRGHGAVGVLQNVGDLVRRRVAAARHVYRTEPEDGEVDQQPLLAGVGDQPDVVAARHPVRRQAGGNGGYLGPQLAKGGGLELAAATPAQQCGAGGMRITNQLKALQKSC